MLSDYPHQAVSYMLQAFSCASISKARRRKAGAIVVKELSPGYFQPLSNGCNGTRPGKSNWCEDPTGRSYVEGVLHAEVNCLKKMQREGIPTKGCIVIVTFIPCSVCAYKLVDAGIVEVLYSEESSSCPNKTTDSIEILRDHGIGVTQIAKEQVLGFCTDISRGLEMDKFMGEPVEEDYKKLQNLVQGKSIEHWKDVISKRERYPIPGEAAISIPLSAMSCNEDLVQSVLDEYTKYRDISEPQFDLVSFFQYLYH